MSTPSAEPQVQNWIKKGEAASMLGISTRQLERYAASGRITARRTLVPGERSDRNLYLQEDVHRLKTDMENRVAAAPKVLSLQEALTRTESPAIAALKAILQQTAPPRIERAWLTLDEAAAYSGLPSTEIARLVREQKVYAMGHGHVTWRIQRESLDRWGKIDHRPAKQTARGTEGFGSTGR